MSLEGYAEDRIDTILTLSCSDMAQATLAGATGNTRYRMAGVWDGSAKCFKQIWSECFFLSFFLLSGILPGIPLHVPLSSLIANIFPARSKQSSPL